jgi:uncharacterized RDD family membrane protein YckC
MDEVIALFETIRPRTPRPAPFAARAAALAIDLLCVGVLEAAGMYVVHETLGREWLAEWLDEILFTCSCAAFLLAVEARFGATIGKRLLQLRVARADGLDVPFRTHVARLAWRFPILFVPTPPALASLFYAAWGLQAAAFVAGAVHSFASRGRTLSDRMTGTRVVYRADAEDPRR